MHDENRNDLREALEDMVWQFGHWGPKDGRLAISTGGLSALEGAFAALGWDDPYMSEDVSKSACHWPGCLRQATVGQPLAGRMLSACSWPIKCLDRETPYARVCGQHAAKLRAMQEAEPRPKP